MGDPAFRDDSQGRGIVSASFPERCAMPRQSSAPRRWLAGTILSLIGFVLAVLTTEVLTRVFFDEPVQPRFVVDSGYGVRWNQARVDTRHYVPKEYEVRVTTNSVGMRGPREYAMEKATGTRRIVLFGDSFTFGFGVEDQDVVSAALERQLSSTGSPAEVLNMGVSGFGQAEELVTWQERGRRYRPDAVVILYVDNDIGNNVVAQLFGVQPDGSVTRTGREFLPGSRLQERLFSIGPVRWLFEHSQAWNLVRSRLSGLVQNAMLRNQGLKTFSDATPAGVGLTKALIAELCREIAAEDAQPIILIIPSQDLRSNFPMTAEEVAGLGASLVDGRTFLTLADYYRTDTHWRASGHRKAAAALAATLAGGAQAPTG